MIHIKDFINSREGPLTALVGVAILSYALIQSLLLSEVVLVSLAVSSRTRAYSTFKRLSPQDLTATRKKQRVGLKYSMQS